MVGMSGDMPGVLKVIIEGYSASFRYPHFVQGIHPTYEMPPPATIYGLVTAVLGDYFAQEALRFAYHFSYRTKFEDYEHLHFPPADMSTKDRALHKEIRSHFGTADFPPAINPFVREMLFEPRLTLYLDRAELAGIDLEVAFREPRYAVTLGRSQDLVTMGHPEVITLRRTDRGFVTGTLLTLTDAAQIGGECYAVTMPRYITPTRQAEWGQYAVVPNHTRPTLVTGENDVGIGMSAPIMWVDSDEKDPIFPELSRAVYWHTWTP